MTQDIRITALQKRPGRKHIELHLDGKFELTVSAESCLRFGLLVGDTLSSSRLDELREAEARRVALEAALRLLSYRQRSEFELRDRLLRKRVRPEIVAETIGRLSHAGLLDDAQFARSWVDRRDLRAPRSRRLMAAELRARGLSRGAVEDATSAVDEREAAYRAAARRARSLPSMPYPQFRQRVGDLLLRRGFDHELVRETVTRPWDERDLTTPTDRGRA